MKKNVFKILFIGFLFSSPFLFEVAEAARSKVGKSSVKKTKKIKREKGTNCNKSSSKKAKKKNQ